jgi:hypothetical protein
MTAENLNWDPNDPAYSSQEAAMTDYRGVVLPCPDRGQPFVINTLSSMTTDAADITDDENFGIALEQHVAVSIAALDMTKTAPGRIHSKAEKPVDAETIAKRWLIPANRAARTVDRTTHRGNQRMATSVVRSLPPILVGLVPIPSSKRGRHMLRARKNVNQKKCQ